MYGVVDVRVESVPDPVIKHPTDALVRVTTSCVCGSDLHPYGSKDASGGGDGGMSSSASWSTPAPPCLRSRRVRPFAPADDGTLVRLPVGAEADAGLMASLLTLSDVYGTGHHAAVRAGVKPGDTVTVIGDGAVALMGVLSAKRLGAEQIILMGRHPVRTDLGVEFGDSDLVAERGEEGIAKVRDLTGGAGSYVVLEAVGHRPAYEQASGVVSPGGVIGQVGVPQYEEAPVGFGSLFGGNVSLTGGPAPARAYIEELMPAILEGTIEPGRVLDSTVDLEGVPDGYQAMADRTGPPGPGHPLSPSVQTTRAPPSEGEPFLSGINPESLVGWRNTPPD